MADSPNGFESECFFIAPIGEEGSDVRKRSDGVLNYIVSRAAEEVGLTAIRADKISSPGQINLQVIEHVLSARAVVADLTGLNPNVFYEMAVRHTAKLPIVLIAERGTDLPFDISQMRTIFFSHTDLADADDCRKAIATQLQDALEGGNVDSPISTALDVSSLSTGSAIDRSVAELVTTVEDLARMQRETREAVAKIDRQTGRAVVQPAVISDLVEAFDHLIAVSDGTVDDPLESVVKEFLNPVRYLSRHGYGLPLNRQRASNKPLPSTENES
ncbi:hypothetical protein ABH923_001707 [Leifsonia sp. EB41]|uniref:hypothetical protein n=1 Tax=Leifsonia sp. EB41 TaxID=3156260 RepID=UPI003517A87D